MNVAALAAGGFIGTVLRYALGEAIPSASNGFPLGTLIINLLGCLFLGWLFTVTAERWRLRPEIRLGLGTGMTGAFTTFSTFSVQTAGLLQQGEWAAAVLYVLASIAGGLLLTYAGIRLARPRRKEGTA
ncbi:fluoride efflux transporter CrcB [Paenibacillus humicola]|uniref:fluoride efflux transporter CrcB n=1 Tax=Paenibacillus humicola TaxID=3110540 RepID=UPI00237AC926|nr:fluoride efflux transporter CrcB [Paenibacillus humicola]